MNIAVIGTEEIAISTAILLSYLDHFVILVDDSQSKVDLLKNNSIRYHEPHLNDCIRTLNDKIHYTTNLTQAIEFSEVVFFTGETGYRLTEVCTIFGESVKNKSKIFINKSACDIGTTGKMEALIKDKSSNFSIAFEAPFAASGRVLLDTFFPDKIVVGIKENISLTYLQDLYNPLVNRQMVASPFVDAPVNKKVQWVLTDVNTAEIAFHAENVSKGIEQVFVNELTTLTHLYGGSSTDLFKILGKKTLPSIGWSTRNNGENFEKIITAATKVGASPCLIEAAYQTNYQHRNDLLPKLEKILDGLDNKIIAFIGLGYKANIDDITDSPIIGIIKKLTTVTDAFVKVHDPIVDFKVKIKHPDLKVKYCDNYYDAFENADIVIYGLDSEGFKHIPWESILGLMKSPKVFDLSNALGKDTMESLGYEFFNYSVRI